MHTKYAIILIDGAADEPVQSLGGKTPLEAARIPNMDWIVEHGRIGTVRTVPAGFTPGSDVATMSLLGYDVRKYYTGRAPIEAVAHNIQLKDDEIVFRCNLVNVTDGAMTDFTAGHIPTEDAEQILSALNEAFTDEPITFHAGVSYRHLMVIRDPLALEAVCMPPHDIPDEPVSEYLPKGKGGPIVRKVMERAARVVADQDVTRKCHQTGGVSPTGIWLWGQGVMPIMPRFRQRFGVRGAVIAAVDLIRGLGKLLGWPIIDVPGATGYLDTDYAAKGRHAIASLDAYDLIAVHIEAPDEAGHMGDAAAKVEAIEQIDAHIVGPLLESLRFFDRWRIFVAPDHPTPVAQRVHTDTPPLFCMAGSDVPKGLVRSAFCERMAAKSDFHVEHGHELMNHFLRR